MMEMNNNLLMNIEEPTDIQLTDLMHEVIIEVKAKAILAQKQLDEKIAREITSVQLKLKAKKN